jgi:hypothetical protein
MDGLVIRLSPSSTYRHLWGSFSLGVTDGFLRSTSPLDSSDGRITFEWRGRETGEQMCLFGPQNRGFVQLEDNGDITGSMYNDYVGQVRFVGRRTDSAEDWSGHVRSWKREFWRVNETTYERERIGRWGKRIPDHLRYDREEENSDTDG